MSDDVPQLDTTGRIADKLGVPLHRVNYVVATRPHIKPAARAGTLRLYSRDAIELIRRELSVIDTKQKGRFRLTPRLAPTKTKTPSGNCCGDFTANGQLGEASA